MNRSPGRGGVLGGRWQHPTTAYHRTRPKGGYDVARAWVQLLAAVMAATNAAAWVLGSRWERPGDGAELRARLQPPPLIGRGGDLVQVAPFVYPVLVVVAPGWAYEGWLNWSTEIDLVLQAVGLGLWALGIAVGLR